ncbi:oxidoreductase [Dictyobacter sp. S3.2.2.5]|uniref:Oxidoreductase n=1 Tax=Dictyobacter halimunensis TaxID=3026934 RepID=A0ABQ6FP18_9CHLR|nr:oxidoreductase [Dictyobacter sp. S3.2.2.5]
MIAYHSGELEVQIRAGVQTGAVRINKGIRETIPVIAQTFLREQRMVVVSSVDQEGHLWASLLTGKPGFLQTPDDQTVEIRAVPRPGDPLATSLRVGAAIGMIMIDFATRRRMRVNGRGKNTQNGIVVHVEQVYSNCPKYIQARALVTEDSNEQPVPTAGVAPAAHMQELTGEQRSWIERADTFFVASNHPAGGSDASHRGGPPGFVRVESATRLVFPDYAGNQMFQTLGNISVQPHAGLLFLDFESGDTLQLSGQAHVIWERERVAAFPGAQRLLEFTIEEAIETRHAVPLRWQLIEYSPFLPDVTPQDTPASLSTIYEQ